MYSLLLCNIYVNGYYLLSLLNANKSHMSLSMLVVICFHFYLIQTVFKSIEGFFGVG